MKLISCYIEGYGCLKQKEIFFDGSLTQILAQNGEGKSTIASFLKAMLYGLKSYRKGSVEFCDREHFYPFGGGKFGGNLLFTWQGKRYKIERFFGAKSETDDTLAVYENGDLTNAFGGEIGKAVLGLDRESFERTLFLSGGDVEISSTSCINAAFLGVAAAGDEHGVENVLDALDKAAKTYKKSKAGRDKITAVKEEIAALDAKIDAARAARSALAGKYARLETIGREIQTFSAQQSAAQQQSAWEAQWAHYRELSTAAERKEWEYSAVLARYPFGLPTIEEAYAAREEKRAVEKLSLNGAMEKSAGVKPSILAMLSAGVMLAAAIVFFLCTMLVAGVICAVLSAGALFVGVRLRGKEKGKTAADTASKQGAEAAVAAASSRCPLICWPVFPCTLPWAQTSFPPASVPWHPRCVTSKTAMWIGFWEFPPLVLP